MNAVSTIAQHYEYPSPERRALSIARADAGDLDNRHQQTTRSDTSGADDVIQGEVIGAKQSPSDELQVRGVTLIGSPYRALDALSTYQLHQTISPSTVKLPGEHFHAQV